MIGSGLPPLKALRAFEATARHLSVKEAAAELCVTAGAVSQLLKTLELHLGVKLFRRANRGIFLTDVGQSYLPAIRNAFRQIEEASRRIAAAEESNLLTISATPFFAGSWLVPRLHAFQEAHPGIDLQVQTSSALVDFSRETVDVAVRHGLGRYAGLRSDRVIAPETVALAAPSLVAKLGGLPAAPAGLVRWPKVHDAERKGWARWFEAQGVNEIGPAQGPAFDDSSLLLKAILTGQGAGLLPEAMVAAELGDGRLVKLADAMLLEDFAYYLVCPQASSEKPKIAAFRAWILEAAEAERAPRPAASGG